MYIEPVEDLKAKDRDFSRALNSLKEEIEAIDWYQQRVASTSDEELKKIVAHNRDEEIEHAVMMLEWLRRNMPAWDEQMKKILFKSAPITELEDAEENSESSGLNLRNLK